MAVGLPVPLVPSDAGRRLGALDPAEEFEAAVFWEEAEEIEEGELRELGLLGEGGVLELGPRTLPPELDMSPLFKTGVSQGLSIWAKGPAMSASLSRGGSHLPEGRLELKENMKGRTGEEDRRGHGQVL